MQDAEADIVVGLNALVILSDGVPERLEVFAQLRCFYLNRCLDVVDMLCELLLRVEDVFEDVALVLELIPSLGFLRDVLQEVENAE